MSAVTSVTLEWENGNIKSKVKQPMSYEVLKDTETTMWLFL